MDYTASDGSCNQQGQTGTTCHTEDNSDTYKRKFNNALSGYCNDQQANCNDHECDWTNTAEKLTYQRCWVTTP